jgi:hypothetical protein
MLPASIVEFVDHPIKIRQRIHVFRVLSYPRCSNPFDQNAWVRHIPPPEMWESDLSSKENRVTSFGIRHVKCFLGTG